MGRTELEHNFAVERELAGRLREAAPSERRGLYPVVYDEFFKRARNVGHTIPNAREIARQVRLATRFLPADGSYLEIGAGTGYVAEAIALSAKTVQIVEVSEVVGRANVDVVITDGVEVPVPAGSVDVVYSNQVMEHLHPDDALAQVVNIRRALTGRGVYVCITPNRLTGPHDVSKHFGNILQGFHLREYTIRDLATGFRWAGFSRVTVAVAVGGEVLVEIPAGFYVWLERVGALLPRAMRRRHPFRKLFDPGAVIARV